MKKTILALAAIAALCSCAARYSEGDVKYKFWDGYDKEGLPDFAALGKPSETGTASTFSLGSHSDEAIDHFAAEFTSTLTVPAEKEYGFLLTSDDDSQLIIDGETLIDINASGDSSIGKKVLGKGRHKVTVRYYENYAGQRLGLQMYSEGELPREYGTEEPEDVIPDFVMPQADEAYKRYEEWKGDDGTVIFPILTDVHAHTDYRFRHVGYIAKTSEIWDYDFMLSLGDIGVNLGPAHISRDIATSIMCKTRDEMLKFPGVFLYAPGNHDWDAGEGTFNSEERFQDIFQKPGLEKAGGNLHLTPGKVYHYYDIPEKNFRIILLNSCGTGTQQEKYYYFDDEQVEWFKSIVNDTPSEMSILVACHYMPHPNGRWHNTPAPYTQVSNERMMDVLAGLKKEHNIVGLFCGDSHFNMHEVDRNVNYFITQSYGYCTPSQLMPGTRRADYNIDESLCCDVIAVKPGKNEVHTFRIGAGGAEYDYEFNY